MPKWCKLFTLVLMSFSWQIQAHPSLHSVLALDVKEKTIEADLHITLSELEPILRNADIRNYIAQHIHVRSVDGRPWVVTIAPDLKFITNEGPADVVAHLQFVPAEGTSLRDFIIDSDLILHQTLNHKMFVTLRSDWHTGVLEENAKVIKIIQFLHTSARVDLTQGSIWRGFLATFNLGMRHIAEGTDHLLFLLMLMLPAVLIARHGRWSTFRGTRESLIQLLQIITAFTIGHSLTLIIGAFDWFRLPEPLVESMIAVSILISAVHALRPIFPDREFWVAAGFGLIHGLAFSSVVAGFHLGPRELVLSILGFNLGIEAMQLAIVCVAVPWLIILAKDPGYRWFRLVLASFGGLAALGWLGERSLEIVNPMEPAVAFAEKYALEFTVALAAFICLRMLVISGRIPALKRK